MTKNKIPNKSPKRKTKKEIISSAINFFNRNKDKSYSLREIGIELKIKTHPERLILQSIIDDLIEDNFIVRQDKTKFRLNLKEEFLEGRFVRRSSGHNQFILEDESQSAIYVSDKNSAHALSGDKVKVQMLPQRKDRDPEAEVIDIIERKQTRFVGTLVLKKTFAFLEMDSKVLANDIFIPINKLKGGKTGDKALIEIIEWPKKAKNPVGEVIDILGKAGSNNAEMHAILAEFGLPYRYPKEVEDEAEKISDRIPEEEISKREDLRNVTTCTIDPKDAKDFDDALSIQLLDNGNWEIGVHIADVTHYVKEGGIIDKEGETRATSVYLVDRTIPMLPERLSNGLCSLRPNEDKLTYSAIFEMNNDADIVKYRIVRTVINSNKRFTYEEAQQIIETGDGEYKDEVLKLDELAKKLRKKRFEHGAIAFEREEVRFEIDKDGKPISVYFKESKDSNKLIEEFMLLANKTVAEFVGKVPKDKHAKTFVYRIHGLPNPEKMTNMAQFVKGFGYNVKIEGSNATVSKSINHLLNEVHNKPEENLISTIAIRAMAKAVYSTSNIGHYGLAFDYYTHFTSPIRRYPDMMVHRLLTRYLNGESSVNQQHCEDECKHCSEMEQIAANAERASIKYKQVEFMSDRIGVIFKAVVSGVAEWGIYAEIEENKCEGLVPMRELDDDFYEFDEKNYRLVGRKKKKEYRLGDEIKVKVVKANLDRKQLDFVLVS